MATYQDIRNEIKQLLAKNSGLCMMTREQIFQLVAEITMVSDDLTDFIRDVDRSISDLAMSIQERCPDCTKTEIARITKQSTAPLVADKDWANKQLSLMKDMRITALAARKTTD